MNLIGSRPDGWWRDRAGAWRKLAGQLEDYALETGDEVSLVLDGRRPKTWEEGERVDVSFAPGGPNAADDAIAARVSADESPQSLVVVTSDRELARRVGELGAEVVGASAFRSELESM
jgi:predicted RNA-binding protein with PIN domain